MSNRVVIPKDCAVCDSCNMGLTDGQFVATEEICYWITGNLVCEKCYLAYYKSAVESGDYQMIRIIHKGDDLSKTELALPIIFESFGSDDLTEN